MTLASIVEKETAVAAERPVIASVFINRLNKGMRLQSDPTIIYGIVGGKGRLDRALTRTDIQTATPYNTYRINGLPPGPIANPGRAALEAVLTPQPTEYIYFVADGSGGHAFAVTLGLKEGGVDYALDEHNANVRQWRKIAGNAAAAAAAEEDEASSGEAAPAPVSEPAPADDTQGPLADVVPDAPASPPPPAQKPAAEAEAPAKPVALAPGTIVTVEGRAAVIPRLRPAR